MCCVGGSDWGWDGATGTQQQKVIIPLGKSMKYSFTYNNVRSLFRCFLPVLDAMNRSLFALHIYLTVFATTYPITSCCVRVKRCVYIEDQKLGNLSLDVCPFTFVLRSSMALLFPSYVLAYRDALRVILCNTLSRQLQR